MLPTLRKIRNIYIVALAVVFTFLACGGTAAAEEFVQSTRKFAHSRARPSRACKLIDIQLLHKQAEQGDAQAQFELGFRYHNGEGVPQDDAEATKWYHCAAEQDHANAQVMLGLMYWNGRGVWQDRTKATKWFSCAAEQGNADGQYHLGYAYLRGEGVQSSAAEAMRWFRSAAEQGQEQAAEWTNRKGTNRKKKRPGGAQSGRSSRHEDFSELDSRELDWVAEKLEIPREKLRTEGRKAYKRKMMSAHPDRQGGTEEAAKDLTKARRVLEKNGLFWE